VFRHYCFFKESSRKTNIMMTYELLMKDISVAFDGGFRYGRNPKP